MSRYSCGTINTFCIPRIETNISARFVSGETSFNAPKDGIARANAKRDVQEFWKTKLLFVGWMPSQKVLSMPADVKKEVLWGIYLSNGESLSYTRGRNDDKFLRKTFIGRRTVDARRCRCMKKMKTRRNDCNTITQEHEAIKSTRWCLRR